jgi:hypothetical protein
MATAEIVRVCGVRCRLVELKAAQRSGLSTAFWAVPFLVAVIYPDGGAKLGCIALQQWLQVMTCIRLRHFGDFFGSTGRNDLSAL